MVRKSVLVTLTKELYYSVCNQFLHGFIKLPLTEVTSNIPEGIFDSILDKPSWGDLTLSRPRGPYGPHRIFARVSRVSFITFC